MMMLESKEKESIVGTTTGDGESGSEEKVDPKTATATSIPPEIIEQKHPLQNEWKFWYFENIKERKWEDNLRVVSPFSAVEDFWSVFNHIKSASELKPGCSYFVFKEHLKPMWEDKGNCAGGRWLMNFDRRFRQSLDNNWLEVLLCLIGEAFDDDGEDICGAVVDVRPKMDKIAIWTADSKNTERIMNIGHKIAERLNLQRNSLTYESHIDTQSKTSSAAKHSYII